MAPTGLLVGYGSIGRRHLTNLHALGVDDWAVVHTGNGTLGFEPPCPVRTYPDLPSALTAETPTFAVVANPTAFHLATALDCVQAGCHVLVEKPVSDRAEGLDELRRAAHERGVHILVGFQFRFETGLGLIADALRSGSIGDPLHARVNWGEHLPDWHPWEDWRTGYAARRDLGGGVHHTLCHPLDYLRMLFGEAEVIGAVLTDDGPLGLEVAECADLVLRFGGEVTAAVHLDFWAQPPVHRLEIVGTRGTLAWNHVAGTLDRWDADAEEWSRTTIPGVAGRDELFVSEVRHFLDVVAGTTAPRCDIDDGIAAVELCVAIERAAQTTAPTGLENA